MNLSTLEVVVSRSMLPCQRPDQWGRAVLISKDSGGNGLRCLYLYGFGSNRGAVEVNTQGVTNRTSHFQLSFNGLLKIDFQGLRITSDGSLVLVRELDERLGLG